MKFARRGTSSPPSMVSFVRRSLPREPNQRHPPGINAQHDDGFIGVAVAWQFVFLLISRDPVRYRPIMLAAVVEKASFGLPAIALYVAGSIARGDARGWSAHYRRSLHRGIQADSGLGSLRP